MTCFASLETNASLSSESSIVRCVNLTGVGSPGSLSRRRFPGDEDDNLLAFLGGDAGFGSPECFKGVDRTNLGGRKTLAVTRKYTASFASSNCVDLKILSSSNNQPWSKHSPDQDLIHNARTICVKQKMNV